MHLWRSVSHHQRTLYAGLAIGAALTLLMLLVLQGLPIFTRAELAAYDFQFQRRGDRPAPANVVVVGLDDASVQDLSAGRYPIPRRFMADAITFLHRAGAAVIAPDFAYIGPSMYGPADDRALARAVRAAGNVVLPSIIPTASASQFVQCMTSIELPLDALNAGAAGVGLANVPVDQDGAVRSADLLQTAHLAKGNECVPGGNLPSFPLAIASVALDRSPAAIVRGLGSRIQINYNGYQYPGDAAQTTFRYVQFEAVARQQDDPAIFRHKVVLIIPAAAITKDLFNTPYGLMYGGFVQANTVNTILRRDPIVPASPLTNDLLLLIVGLMTTMVGATLGIWRSSAVALFGAVGFVLLSSLLFAGARIWINLVTPEVCIVIVFGAIMALRFATEERLRKKATATFGRYVKGEIVDILMNAGDPAAALRGIRRPISVLFVDIRGFTSMSEHMAPERVVATLDVYLEQLSRCVDELNGAVDKYVGDELMALWNALPYPQEDHALCAVRCALSMVVHAENINRELVTQGLPEIHYGIGVNSGDAVVGQMGSSVRATYTAIGDTVNTGARLCSAAGKNEILIGQATWEMIGPSLVTEETEPLLLKGKTDPLRTFRVLGIREEAGQVPLAVPAPA
ncbi:MAG TPA: adenylate/guanylate cyclase domain-containing protein [Chloroflexota bacterium]|nr:adenylate/guanylate cyclase domain-containing protein [Chloroflexota bacterium]